jgi:hypothetical protein
MFLLNCTGKGETAGFTVLVTLLHDFILNLDS